MNGNLTCPGESRACPDSLVRYGSPPPHSHVGWAVSTLRRCPPAQGEVVHAQHRGHRPGGSREHTESTARQYGGLGPVGRGPQRLHRAGGPGSVPARSARSSGSRSPGWPARMPRWRGGEVARLTEFAAITETLLIDADGVYDPRDVNDLMLLATKSTIGEVELHVMAQRLQASKRGRGRARRAAQPAAGRICPRRGRPGRHQPRCRGPGRDS
jgi:hypothetical protein